MLRGQSPTSACRAVAGQSIFQSVLFRPVRAKATRSLDCVAVCRAVNTARAPLQHRHSSSLADCSIAGPAPLALTLRRPRQRELLVSSAISRLSPSGHNFAGVVCIPKVSSPVLRFQAKLGFGRCRSIRPGYRLNRAELPGKPDIAYIGSKRAIFVHGCFWHGHDCARGARVPKQNRDYWLTKIARNIARDQRNLAILTDCGWAALVVWECELKDQNAVAGRLTDFLV